MSVQQATFKWTIPDYKNDSQTEKKQRFIIPVNVDSGETVNIVLTICISSIINRATVDSVINFSFIIEQCEKSLCPDEIFVKFAILNGLNDEEEIFTLTRKIPKQMIVTGSKAYNNVGVLIKHILLKSLFTNDLILLSDFEFHYDSKLENVTSTDQEDFLYNSEMFHDITICIKDKSIKANKAILASKSEVFSKMFTTDMKESKEKVVKVVDIHFEVFRELLRFLYTGDVKNLNFYAIEILEAAHFYQIHSLMSLCENYLAKCVNVKNVITLLQVSQKCRIEKLKACCLSVIFQHLEHFQKSPQVDNSSLDMLQLFMQRLDLS